MMNMDCSFIADFGQSYTLTRYTAGSYTQGVFSPGTSSTQSIQASIQPLAGQETVRSTDGNRPTQKVKIYTVTQLFGAVDSLTPPDEITYQGDQYQVQDVQPWGNYFYAEAVRKGGN